MGKGKIKGFGPSHTIRKFRLKLSGGSSAESPVLKDLVVFRAF